MTSEESTTSDLVERMRRVIDAVNRADLDAAMSYYAPDAVWEAVGLGENFDGVAAIRVLYRDWIGAYEEYEIVPEEIVDLGGGVVLVVNHQTGRPIGSTGDIRLRQGTIAVWVEGVIVRITTHTDIDEARAAAGRLAEERG